MAEILRLLASSSGDLMRKAKMQGNTQQEIEVQARDKNLRIYLSVENDSGKEVHKLFMILQTEVVSLAVRKLNISFNEITSFSWINRNTQIIITKSDRTFEINYVEDLEFHEFKRIMSDLLFRYNIKRNNEYARIINVDRSSDFSGDYLQQIGDEDDESPQIESINTNRISNPWKENQCSSNVKKPTATNDNKNAHHLLELKNSTSKETAKDRSSTSADESAQLLPTYDSKVRGWFCQNCGILNPEQFLQCNCRKRRPADDPIGANDGNNLTIEVQVSSTRCNLNGLNLEADAAAITLNDGIIVVDEMNR